MNIIYYFCKNNANNNTNHNANHNAMCIAIQVKLKTAVVGFILGALALGTYLGHNSIQTNIADRSNQAELHCELITSHPSGQHGVSKWHNTWDYVFQNETFTTTNVTLVEPQSHVCCVDVSDPYTITVCVRNMVTMYVFYLSSGWFVGWCILVVMWVCRDKQPAPL